MSKEQGGIPGVTQFDKLKEIGGIDESANIAAENPELASKLGVVAGGVLAGVTAVGIGYLIKNWGVEQQGGLLLETAAEEGQVLVQAIRSEVAQTFVYRSVDALGRVQYVGITNDLARRAAEQLSGKGIQIEKLLGGLTRSDARAVEQALIEIHGLGKTGGTLINMINSIARSNPIYAQSVERAYQLLQQVGYK
jgi:hypothetical protein